MTLIRLPLAPSTNHLFVNAGKRRVVSKPYASWRNEAGWLLQAARIAPLGHMRVQLEISVNENMRGDASNRIKAAEDLLVTHRIIDDDKQVWRVSVEKVAASICPAREMLLSILPFSERTT